MPASRRDRRLFLLLIGAHLAIACLADYIDLAWGRFFWSRAIWAGFGMRGSGPTLVTAFLVGAFAADAGLLGAWAVLAPFGRIVRWLATAFCTACWSFGFLGQSPRQVCRQTFWRYGWFEFESPSLDNVFLYTAIIGLPTLVVLGTILGLLVVKRRGARLTRLTVADLARERSSRQFEISHLLLFLFVLSVLLALGNKVRSSLDADARAEPPHTIAAGPVHSAETVLVTALLWCTINLSQIWAVLSVGRPWWRMAMSCVASAAMGFTWAFTFTKPQHQEDLFWNAVAAIGTALGQVLWINLPLLLLRRGGYRLAHNATDNSLSALDESQSGQAPGTLATASNAQHEDP